jgi:hypothetical protein
MHRNLPEHSYVNARPNFGRAVEVENCTDNARTAHSLMKLVEDLECASGGCRDIGRIDASISLARAARQLGILASLQSNAVKIAPE